MMNTSHHSSSDIITANAHKLLRYNRIKTPSYLLTYYLPLMAQALFLNQKVFIYHVKAH